MRFFDNLPYIDFMKYKNIALSISWGLIVVCILIAQPWKGGESRIKVGMQFTGGIDMQVRFRGDVPQDRVREALAKGGFPDAAVVAFDAPKGFHDYSVKVKARKDQDEKDASVQSNQIRTILKALDPEAARDPRPALNSESVGGLVDAWIATNPLGVQGDAAAIRAAYEPLVGKLMDARGDRGLLSDWNQLPQDLPPQLMERVKGTYRLGNFAVLKNESFSPSISGEWTRKTLTAVAWAMGAILIYVMFRFTASFAIGGIVALIHDLLMALGIFTLFGFEYSVPVVASFLILMGYSMSDTIVIFDRIRENSRRPEYRRATITKLVNDSINQTLSRTILTSTCVLFCSFSLFYWGGPALRDLAFPIFIGVIIGTFSSVYIASPVVVLWEKWFPQSDNMKQKHA